MQQLWLCEVKVTAAFFNENYIEVKNASKIKLINAAYDVLSTMSLPGEYEIEWSVHDGIIQDVWSGYADHDVGDVILAGPIGLKQAVDRLLAEVLQSNWTGIARISWSIDKWAKVTPRVTRKLKVSC